MGGHGIPGCMRGQAKKTSGSGREPQKSCSRVGLTRKMLLMRVILIYAVQTVVMDAAARRKSARVASLAEDVVTTAVDVNSTVTIATTPEKLIAAPC